MLIETREERLIIVSDLHVGSPFSRARQTIGAFFDYARRERFNLCINGDGFEILQASFSSLAHDSIGIITQVRAHLDAGLKVYYVVGNHDIVLEGFLRKWQGIAITPFLNVNAGSLRVRVEHGHLYDPWFIRSPKLYEALTRFAGVFVRFWPDVYRVWAYWERFWQRLRALNSRNLVDRDLYYQAADLLLSRGFDVVVFGHTHNAEDVLLGDGRRYINSGNWVRGGSFVQIRGSAIELKQWNTARAEPADDG